MKFLAAYLSIPFSIRVNAARILVCILKQFLPTSNWVILTLNTSIIKLNRECQVLQAPGTCMPWQSKRCWLSERNKNLQETHLLAARSSSVVWGAVGRLDTASPAFDNVLSPVPRSKKANAPHPGLVPFFKVAEDCEADFSILDDSQWSVSNCIIL